MAARDGQRFDQQSWQTQEDYRAIYGGNAESQWEADHDRALGGDGGGDSGGGDGSGSGGDSGGGTGSGTSYNPEAANAALQAANMAAQIAYNNYRLKHLEIPQFKFQSKLERDKYELEIDRFAFDKARDAFDQKIKEAGLTGTYNGQPILQKILAEAELTGMYGGQKTLARESMENQTALGLMNLLSTMHGPKNAIDYIRTLNGTPGGLRDVVNSLAGRFSIPGFGGAAQNAPIEGRTLAGLVQDILTGGGSASTAPQQNATVSPPGAPAPAAQYNYTPTADGNTVVSPPGNPAPVEAPQVSAAAPLSQDQLAAQIAGNFGGAMTGIGGLGGSSEDMASLTAQLPRPNQFIAKNWLNLDPYTRDVYTNLYENLGYDAESMQHQFMASLPKYGGAAQGRIAGVV